MSQIRLGTRGSKLALAQSNMIANQLRDLGHDVELIILQTTGDVTTGSLKQVGGDGLFTSRLQTALLENEIDLAVHSLKDLPTEPVDGLKIGAVPKREDPRDALIFPVDAPAISSLQDLPQGCRIGTGSVRRKAQLLYLRPDLIVEDIRGNVDTRLAKLDDGQFDAIVLACAGLNRLGLSNRISYICSPDELAPAVGQGALGLEIRSSDNETLQVLETINNLQTHACVIAERKMLNRLSAGCLAPVGAISSIENQELALSGIVLSKNGDQKISAKATGPFAAPLELATDVAAKLIEQNADKLIAEFR